MSAILTVTDRERDLAERLADAQRLICDLAAQVEAMRAGLMSAKDSLWNYGCARQAEAAERVLDLSNTAAILRQRDADLIARTIALMGTSFDGTIEDFQNELERKNG